MFAIHATLSLPDGRSFVVLPGSVVGRMEGCAVQLDDPEVSEAHAFVSWREGKLRLLALRGTVHANGTALADVALRPRMEIRVSAETVLTVRGVAVPDEILWLEGVEGGAAPVTGAVHSVVGAPARLVPGLQHDAWLWLWTEGAVWFARGREGMARPVEAGDAWPSGDGTLTARLRTRPDLGSITRASGSPVIHVTLGEGVVRLRSGQSPPLSLGGNQGDFVRQLAEATDPVHWTTIARYFWGERDQLKWRERFDAMVKEVRGKFKENRIRPDLLWSWDGSYRLNLGEEDSVTGGG